VKGENPNGIDDVGCCLEFFLFFFNDDQLCLIALCVRASYLRFWVFKATFYAQWKARIPMALKVLAEVESSFVGTSMMTSCALSLCARGRRIWESELLRPLVVLSERREFHWYWQCWLKLSFRFCSFKWWPAVPIHFARGGVLFESLYFWGNFSCSVKAENFTDIDDLGWSWVFDCWQCWLKWVFDFCFWIMLCVEFFLNWVVYFARADVCVCVWVCVSVCVCVFVWQVHCHGISC